MTRRTREEALVELSTLVTEADLLRQSVCRSTEHTRWLAHTFRFLEDVFGISSIYYISIKKLTWRNTRGFVADVWTYEDEIRQRDHEVFLRDLGTAKGLLQAAHDELTRSSLDGVYKGVDGPKESSAILKVLAVAERKLRKVFRQTPADEREVQDAFENLLIGADIEYSRETESIEYSSKTYIPDFSVSKADLAIELKLSARAGREKEMISEINDDILAYKLKFKNVLFVVYDTGYIRDVDRFIDSFQENDGVVVRVVKH